ncbi:MAG: DUF488 family protein [Muribaculaceae bacterium]|nr:DUF488 family protein [Muribaculaceae bacterium]
MNQEIAIKRAYSPESTDDGYRVYVDRLWPRGLSHETFHYDEWVKDIAPSAELRKWFHENPTAEWNEFEKRYRAELLANPAFETFKEQIKDKPKITLLFSSHDEEHNNALVLENVLKGI